MGSDEARDTTGTHAAGSWAEGELVDRWIAGDSLAAVLDLPRRITASLVRESGIDVRRVVDVGAGTGAFLRGLLEEFEGADGVWVDASDAMLERARRSLADLGSRVTFAIGDLREPESLPLAGDVVMSARAIHHFRPETIERFYQAAADALSPGGFLANLDHFATPGAWEPRYRAIRPSLVGGNAEPATLTPTMLPRNPSTTTSAGSGWRGSRSRTSRGGSSGRRWSSHGPLRADASALIPELERPSADRSPALQPSSTTTDTTRA